MRRYRKILYVLIGLAGISLFLTPVRDLLWAALFLKDFMAGEGASLFKLLTPEPAVTNGTIALGGALEVPFDLYRCPAATPAAGIVLTHGLAHRGNRDPRIQEQSRRLSRAGFVVMAPDLQQMKHYQLGFGDAEALAAAVQHLRSLPGVDPSRIGIIAPSFSAGLALIALSRPPLRDQVRFAMVLGAYYDLKRTLRYTLTGAYDAEGYAGRADLTINRHNRWKFLQGNAGLLPSSPSREAYLRFAAVKSEDLGLDILPVLSHFSEEEQRLLVFMDNEEPTCFDSLYAILPAQLHSWVGTLSLHHYTPSIKTKLLIVHSDADEKVSFTESLALSRNLPNAPPPEVFIIGLFSHVDLKLRWDSFEIIWQRFLPGMGQLWSLAYQLLGQRP